jgi:hypothetical protein
MTTHNFYYYSQNRLIQTSQTGQWYSDTSPFSIPWNEERLECGRALCLQGYTHPLHWSEREREREREIKKERGREREIKREGEYLFLKGMMGALAPFSYLVL